ncbi:MAG TPA: hypothetical protein VIK28_09990 [Sedimentisphaerales bacterium]
MSSHAYGATLNVMHPIDAALRDKKIWAIVAFLKKLSSVSDENFNAWNEAPLGGHWVPACGPGRMSGCGPGRG